MMEEAIEDLRRGRKIEKELRNKKRPWFLRRYLGRDLMQWANLYLGLFIIIITLNKSPVWNMLDLSMMVMAGFNIAIWFWGKIINDQRDFIDEVLEMNKKTLKLASQAMGEKMGFLQRGEEYYEI